MSRNERRYVSAKEVAEKQDSGGAFPYMKMPQGAQLFKLKEGHMLIDVLPYVVGKGNPFADKGMWYWERTFWVHRSIGANEDSYLCLRKTFNEPCPVCEHRAKLQKQADDDNEVEIKALNPSQRQLLNVIDLKNPDKGVQIYNTSYHLFGKKLNQELLSAEEDDGWEKFYQLDGMSLKLGVGEDSFGGRSYNKVETLHFKIRKQEYDEDILEKVFVLDELLIKMPYDKLKAILLQTDVADKDEDEDEERPKKKSRHADDDDDEAPKKKRQVRDEEADDGDDDADEKPKKKRVVEDEDEDEERPKKKRASDDDDDEVPKKKKPSADDDDWDEFNDDDEKPKKKKVVDDDDDEAPKKKRAADDDEDEELPKKKKVVDDDDDWDDKPKKKRVDDDDDDEPKKKRRASDDDDDDEKPRVKTRDEVLDDDEDEERPKKKARH